MYSVKRKVTGTPVKQKGYETTSPKHSNRLKTEAPTHAETSAERSQCVFEAFGTRAIFQTVNLHKLFHSLSVYGLSVALLINLSVKVVCL